MDERRARLLEVGRRLAGERGYDDFSVEELAATAGVSQSEVHRIFPGKRYLYVETLRSALAGMLAELEPQPGLSPERQLRLAIDRYLTYVRDHAAAYRAVLRGAIGADPEVAAIIDDFRLTVAERILRGLGTAGDSPEVRLAVVGWVGLVEAASLDWLDREGLSRACVADLLVSALPAVVMAAG